MTYKPYGLQAHTKRRSITVYMRNCPICGRTNTPNMWGRFDANCHNCNSFLDEQRAWTHEFNRMIGEG